MQTERVKSIKYMKWKECRTRQETFNCVVYIILSFNIFSLLHLLFSSLDAISLSFKTFARHMRKLVQKNNYIMNRTWMNRRVQIITTSTCSYIVRGWHGWLVFVTYRKNMKWITYDMNENDTWQQINKMAQIIIESLVKAILMILLFTSIIRNVSVFEFCENRFHEVISVGILKIWIWRSSLWWGIWVLGWVNNDMRTARLRSRLKA